MKSYLLLMTIFVLVGNSYAQSMKEARDTKLYLITDVKTVSSANNSSNSNVSSTGVGKLGITFKSEYFYGSVLFNVTSRNKELTTTDSTESKIFANNLLIPDNSGQGISNFNVSLGAKSFSSHEEDWNKVKPIS